MVEAVGITKRIIGEFEKGYGWQCLLWQPQL